MFNNNVDSVIRVFTQTHNKLTNIIRDLQEEVADHEDIASLHITEANVARAEISRAETINKNLGKLIGQY